MNFSGIFEFILRMLGAVVAPLKELRKGDTAPCGVRGRFLNIDKLSSQYPSSGRHRDLPLQMIVLYIL